MANHANRAHAVLSASSSARWLACPPSAIAASAYPNETSPYAQEGTLAHEVAEIVARRTIPQLYPEIDTMEYPEGHNAEMIECAEGYAEYILERITTDDALVMLEQRVDFSEWVPDGFGTADCVLIQGTVMDVIDYKYGMGVPVSATENPQMMLYGLGAYNDYGFAWDEIETIRVHVYQPRINNVSVFEISVKDLLAWAEKVVAPTAKLAAAGKGKYAAGAHCRFCPHAGRCRTLNAICSEFVQVHGSRVKLPVLAPHEVAEVLAMEPVINIWLKRVKETAMGHLLAGKPIPGYKVVTGKGSRSWADDLAAAKALNAAGYDNDQITETKLLSPAAMEKAIGKKRVAELVGGHILKSPGAPTIAPETDKRPSHNPADDFTVLD